ncbi:MAG: glycosyltransferase family 2 protein [Elusimicrobiota bacterium]
MSCSVIIPSYNTRELTLECVQSLLGRPAGRVSDIILVDNNSSDGTAEEVVRRFPAVRVVKNQRNLGFAKACNAGARIARSEYLVFLNSDAVLLGDALEVLARWLDSHSRSAAVGPELLSPGGEIIQMSWGWNPVLLGEFFQRVFAPSRLQGSFWRKKCVKILQRRLRSVPYICGACMMVRKAAFESVGGFDENFELYFEDADLCRRLSRAGWGVDFLPAAKVSHLLGQSGSDSSGIVSLVYRQSQILYYRKHAPWALALLKRYLLRKRLRRNEGLEDRENSYRASYRAAYEDVVRETRKISLAEPYDPAASSRPSPAKNIF